MTTETWTNVADAANGYVDPSYVTGIYVFGTSGATWSDASGNAETWENQTDDFVADGFVKIRYVLRDNAVAEIWTVIGP
jgi:hypothetical protein